MRKIPAVQKVKQAILDLPDSEQDEIAAWLKMFIETRDQERERRRKRDAKRELEP